MGYETPIILAFKITNIFALYLVLILKPMHVLTVNSLPAKCACGRFGVVGLCVKSQKQNGNAKKVAADDDYRWVQKHAQHQ